MRLYISLLLALVFASPAWSMEHFTRPLQDQNGRAISGATVTVYNAGTTTLATIYSDNGATTKANPFTTGVDGLYDFYAANGVYDLVFAKPGYFFDPAKTRRVAVMDINDGGGGGGGGGSSFDLVTSGTNTSASMICGTGCTLTLSGSGIINANRFKGNTLVSVNDGGTGLPSAPDDTMLIGTGGGYSSVALPSCNATTEKPIYVAASNSWTCATDAGGGAASFTTITSGTNTASLLIGTGGILSPAAGTSGAVVSSAARWRATTVNAGNSPYTVGATDYYLICDATAGARSITLTDAITATNTYTVYVLGSNGCTVNRSGSNTINTGLTTGTSYTIRNAGSNFWFRPDSAGIWYIGG